MSKRKKDSTNKGPTKSDRARTRERRQKRQQMKRKRQRTFAMIAVVVAIVVAGLLFVIVNQSADAPIPAGTIERYDGIPQGLTDNGFPVLGNPDAPVTVTEYSNFSCPSCAIFHASAMDDLVQMVRDGKISLVFAPIASTTAAGSNSKGAAKAALCVAEQGMFFEYHDALFDWQSRFGNKAFSQNRLKSGVDSLGLSQSLYGDCDTSYFDDVIDTSENLFAEGSVGQTSYGTPAIFVQGTYVANTGDLVNIIENTVSATGIVPVPLAMPEDDAADDTDATTDDAADDGSDTDTDAADSDTSTEDGAAAADDATDTDTDDAEETPEATAETESDG